jgi:hypothetical protein
VVERPFVIAGWAIDPRAAHGAGIDALHVWAYPIGGGEPRWIGATTTTAPRPDVANLFGARFASSGYAIAVTDLPTGTYDIVVYAHSSATNGFAIARVVRVTVR